VHRCDRGAGPGAAVLSAKSGLRSSLVRRARAGLLAVVVLLYCVSIPWYRRVDAPTEFLLGLPSWVTVALLCYVLAAVLNAAAWLLTDVPDGDPDGEDTSA